jgi:NAD(P)-dependent dehydrogenase (short-subunit alcohol dehydrogenase family)
MNRLKNKVAVVTGGGSGIGRATCQLFAEEGAVVVVAERDPKGGAETQRLVEEAGGRALYVPTDVAEEASVQRMAAEAERAFGPVNVLVNNAAAFVMKGVEATPEEWRLALDVNVMGPALVAKHLVPQMRKAGGGAIVNVASISSFIAQPNVVVYNASKAALANMTRCLALDLVSDNIRANAVCPGTIWTPTVERLSREAGLSRTEADAHPRWGGGHMIPRFGQPREVAYAILFLASDEASFITGENLMVDGGYTAK